MSDNPNLLKIKAEASKLATMYKEDPKQNSFTALITGNLGSGKTFLFRTARKPVHIDSFDPGGLRGLDEYIAKGEIIPDARWEKEDPKKPTVFPLWMKAMAEREKIDYFSQLGTFVIDSSTFWGEAIMNDILRKENVPGTAPKWERDYNPQKVIIRNWVREMVNLPCDFLMTGHLEAIEDKVTKVVTYRYMTTGKGTVLIPALFDEVWVMDPKKVASGVEYRVLTKSTGTYLARSRLAKEGLLDAYEKPDLKHILKKANFATSDKPLLT